MYLNKKCNGYARVIYENGDYYTGMIIEVSPPPAIKIGSIGGGGRYDNLTSKFGLKNISGIGISFGFERIYHVIESLKLFPKNIKKNTSYIAVRVHEDKCYNPNFGE